MARVIVLEYFPASLVVRQPESHPELGTGKLDELTHNFTELV